MQRGPWRKCQWSRGCFFHVLLSFSIERFWVMHFFLVDILAHGHVLAQLPNSFCFFSVEFLWLDQILYLYYCHTFMCQHNPTAWQVDYLACKIFVICGELDEFFTKTTLLILHYQFEDTIECATVTIATIGQLLCYQLICTLMVPQQLYFYSTFYPLMYWGLGNCRATLRQSPAVCCHLYIVLCPNLTWVCPPDSDPSKKHSKTHAARSALVPLGTACLQLSVLTYHTDHSCHTTPPHTISSSQWLHDLYVLHVCQILRYGLITQHKTQV
jgi:hypothetical protein